jgi:hypothetical protein
VRFLRHKITKDGEEVRHCLAPTWSALFYAAERYTLGRATGGFLEELNEATAA